MRSVVLRVTHKLPGRSEMYMVTEGTQPRRIDAASARVQAVPSGPVRDAHTFDAPGLAEVCRWLLRGWIWILVAGLVGGVAGYLFTRSVVPRFTATTDLVVAPSNLRVVNNDLYAPNLQSDAQILDVESKMRVITSSNVLRQVTDRLGLVNDADFHRKAFQIDVSALFGLGPEERSGPTEQSVAAALAERIKVARQERSYVVTVSVWASTADLSAKLANAIAEAFRDEVARGDADRAGRAADSLSDRLGQLKANVAAADAKVEAFRSEHGLLQGSGGQLTTTQAMDRMSDKVTDARARLAEAEARYREVARALDRSGSQAGAVQSPALTSLLGEDAALRRQVAALSKTFGPRHPSLVNAQVEQEAIARAIRAETERLRAAAQVDVSQAKQALNRLTGEMVQLHGMVSEDGRAEVKLRELERDARTKAALYQTFLTRAGEAAERQQIDATDVRVISPALPPRQATWPPRTVVMVAGGCVLGLALAAAVLAGLGYLGAWRRERLRTA